MTLEAIRFDNYVFLIKLSSLLNEKLSLYVLSCCKYLWSLHCVLVFFSILVLVSIPLQSVKKKNKNIILSKSSNSKERKVVYKRLNWKEWFFELTADLFLEQIHRMWDTLFHCLSRIVRNRKDVLKYRRMTQKNFKIFLFIFTVAG